MAGLPEPPKLIRLGKAWEYIRERHSVDITRQTTYNWARVGVNGTKLRTVRKAGIRYTTERWVDEFITNATR